MSTATKTAKCLAEILSILNIHSVLSPAQCALLEDNAEETLRYIARQLATAESAA